MLHINLDFCSIGSRSDSTVAPTTSLDIVRVDTGSATVIIQSSRGFVLALVKHILEVKSMNVTRKITSREMISNLKSQPSHIDWIYSPEKCQADVYEEICAAARNHKHSDGRN